MLAYFTFCSWAFADIRRRTAMGMGYGYGLCSNVQLGERKPASPRAGGSLLLMLKKRERKKEREKKNKKGIYIYIKHN